MTFNFQAWLTETVASSKVLKLSPEAEKWVEVRKDESSRINHETAEVCWDFGEYSDPYKLYPEIPKWARDRRDGFVPQKLYFVRRPNGDVWVWDQHLPDNVRSALRRRLDATESQIPFIKDVTDTCSKNSHRNVGEEHESCLLFAH